MDPPGALNHNSRYGVDWPEGERSLGPSPLPLVPQTARGPGGQAQANLN